MGNTASSNLRAASLDNLVGELGNECQYEKSMGDSRFLKTLKARHICGPLVVKTFFKPNRDAEQGSLSLAELVRRLREERESLADAPNVLAYQTVIETDNAGYLVRQWLASSLYDRISTRPFLTSIEKKWLSFQLLQGMQNARARNVPHGDLKCENILVTSSLVLYITDFAGSIKPTYLPLDDPDDFGVFFDTSSRRTCYLAPERFFPSDSDIAKSRAEQVSRKLGVRDDEVLSKNVAPGTRSTNRSATMADPFTNIVGMDQTKREGQVTEQMDLFAAACVIAELWRDGSPTFTLSQLYQHRSGNFDLGSVLSQIPDADIRSMVKDMLAVKPGQRGSFSRHLQAQCGKAFPVTFYSFLYPYLINIQRSDPSALSKSFGRSMPVSKTLPAAESGAPSSEHDTHSESSSRSGYVTSSLSSLRSEADDRLERLYEDWALIHDRLRGSQKEDSSSTAETKAFGDESPFVHESDSAEGIFPVTLAIPGISPDVLSTRMPNPKEDGQGLLLLSVILSNLRNAARPSTRVHALDMVLHLGNGHITDTCKLDRLLPFVVSLFDDSSAPVRAAACRTATQILMLVEELPSANITVFSEYVVPQFQRLRLDSSVLVRTSYASSLAHLCDTAMMHLNALKPTSASESEKQNFADRQEDLNECLQVEVASLLQDESTTVKCTLLADVERLCACFGVAVANDILLSHMTTYLNNKDWRLRESFFQAIVHVGSIAGGASLESYILPFVMEALSDPEQAVALRVLECLQGLVKSGSLQPAKIHDILETVVCFLCHPAIWLRYQTAGLVAGCLERLDETERWAFAYPYLRPLLDSDVGRITEGELLRAAKHPIPRAIFEAAISWASKAGKSPFWKDTESSASKWPLNHPLSKRGINLMMDVWPRAGAGIMPRNEIDDAHMDRLRALGMQQEDEVKLVAFRTIIARLARQGNSKVFNETHTAAVASLISGKDSIMRLEGINSQNVFFGTRDTDSASTAPSRSEAMSMASRSYRSELASSFSTNVARQRIRGRLASESAQHSFDMDRQPALQQAFSHTTLPSSQSSESRANGIWEQSSEGTVTKGESNIPLRSPLSERHSHRAPALTPLNVHGNRETTDESDVLSHLSLPRQEADDGPFELDQGTQRTIGDENSFVNTYDGADPYLRAHLEFVQLHRSQLRAPPLGRRVPLSQRTRLALGSANSSNTSNRRPEGTLVAYFNEHESAITTLAISTDHLFFVSGSRDGTLRVWDSARLEKNVTSRSRAVYNGHSATGVHPITAAISLTEPRCLASAAEDGSVHVWRVEISASSSLPRYGRSPKLISNFQFSRPSEYATCMVENIYDGSACVVMGTSHGRLCFVDLRTMQVRQTLQNPKHLGAVTCLCEDRARQWLVSGTAEGAMCLWDMRFCLLIRTWQVVPGGQASGARLQSCIHHPRCDPDIVLVGIARDFRARDAHTVVEMWDVRSAKRLSLFGAQGPGSESDGTAARAESGSAPTLLGIDSRLTPAVAIEKLLAREESQSETSLTPQSDDGFAHADALSIVASADGYSSSTPRAVGMEKDWVQVGTDSERGKGPLTSSAGGWMLTAGSDRIIRFWDLGRIEKSSTVSPNDVRGEYKETVTADKSVKAMHYVSTIAATPRTNRSPLSPVQSRDARESMRTHRDAITAMVVLQFPFRCTVSADRSGRILVHE